jgi:hypothetical protein
MMFPLDQAGALPNSLSLPRAERWQIILTRGLAGVLVNFAHICKSWRSRLQLAAMKQFGQADLLFSGGGLPPHDRNVSIRLICNHLPAPGQAGQNRGFGSAL